MMDALQSVPVTYRWLLTLALAALIIGLSITPGVARPDDNLFSWLYASTSTPVQKLMHVTTYALLAFLWMWSLAGIESVRTRIAVSLAVTLGLGIVLEWYQTKVPGRYGTLIDVVLNTIGVALGLVAALLLA